jgi:hypothetical protein
MATQIIECFSRRSGGLKGQDNRMGEDQQDSEREERKMRPLDLLPILTPSILKILLSRQFTAPF